MPNTYAGGDFSNLFSKSMELCVTTAFVSFWVQGFQLLLVEKELTFDDACSRYIMEVQRLVQRTLLNPSHPALSELGHCHRRGPTGRAQTSGHFISMSVSMLL